MLTGNDSDPNSGTILPASINLIPPSGAGNLVYGNGLVKGFSISGQGTWLVDNTGLLTFTPVNNFFSNTTPFSYTIKDAANLTSNQATVTTAVDYCTKPGLTGTPDTYTDLGISTLSARYKNWPAGPGISNGGIPNGALALQSSDKGLVITRVADTSLIANPVKGMIVYDRNAQCVKLYNGTVWNCIKRSCND
uniref:Uncharacterized protein n=1 Tax=Chryseobacterium endophyticum TaxID=1854762 RepID=A0AAU6WMR2_9FLAO